MRLRVERARFLVFMYMQLYVFQVPRKRRQTGHTVAGPCGTYVKSDSGAGPSGVRSDSGAGPTGVRSDSGAGPSGVRSNSGAELCGAGLSGVMSDNGAGPSSVQSDGVAGPSKEEVDSLYQMFEHVYTKQVVAEVIEHGQGKFSTCLDFFLAGPSAESLLSLLRVKFDDVCPVKLAVDEEDRWEDSIAFYKSNRFDAHHPVRVRLSGQPAVDTGGVRRHFFSK